MDRQPVDDRWPGDQAGTGDTETFAPPQAATTDQLPATVRVGGRIGVSLPTALGAAVLVTAIAFGANGLRFANDPSTAGRESAAAASPAAKPDQAAANGIDGKPGAGGHDGVQPPAHPGKEVVEPSEKPAVGTQPTEKPAATLKPTPKPEPKATPKATPKPTPKPVTVGALEITVASVEGLVKVRWSPYKGDGFDYYKIVRSTDDKVTWPTGAGDALVGALEDQAATWLKDSTVAGGKAYWYRVFAVRHAESGYVVLAASAAKRVDVPKPEPKPTPEPYVLGFEVAVGAEGVLLSWEPCGTDGFVYYKVVRSAGPDPSYLPWTDGTELLAVIEDHTVTRFTDGSVASGDTFHYRVQAIGLWDGRKVVLGETPAVAITVP